MTTTMVDDGEKKWFLPYQPDLLAHSQSTQTNDSAGTLSRPIQCEMGFKEAISNSQVGM